MFRIMVAVAAVVVLGLGGALGAAGAELKPIHSEKTKDLVITLANETGQLTKGKNAFVLAFTSAATQQPVDVGTVKFETSMTMPGMAPMLAGATLTPDTTPGRYRGAIDFRDSGRRQVTVSWDGPAGKGSTRFSVPVR